MTMLRWRSELVESLVYLGSGTHGVIRRIEGGRELATRLAGLGLTVEARISVLQNYGKGPIIVSARDTRVALGRGQAAKVMVEMQEKA